MTHKLQLIALVLAVCLPATSYGAAHKLSLEFIPQGVPFNVRYNAEWESSYSRRPGMSQEQRDQMDADERELVEKFDAAATDLCIDNSHLVSLFPEARPALSVDLSVIMRADVSAAGEVTNVRDESRSSYSCILKNSMLSSKEAAQKALFKKSLKDLIDAASRDLVDIVVKNQRYLMIVPDEEVASMKIDLYLELVHDSPPDYADVSAAPASGYPQNPPPGYYPPANE